MYCIYCGTEHSSVAKFCQKCGKPIVRSQTTKAEPESVNTENEASSPPHERIESRSARPHEPVPPLPKLEVFVATAPANHDVYSHPVKGFESVKYGFSWPAFFLGFWWSLYKRLWLNALLFWLIAFAFGFVLGFALAVMNITVSPFTFYLLGFPINLIWGVNGNHWVRQKLVKSGYECVHEGSESGGIPTQKSGVADSDSRGFSCPFCRHTMGDFGQCPKCGNTVDQWVLEANG